MLTAHPKRFRAVPVRQIVKEKTVGDLPLLPFISLFTNCVIWSWYGYLIDDATVMTPNLSGMCFGALYTGVYLKYATKSQAPLVLGSMALVGSVSAAALMLPVEQVTPAIGYLGNGQSVLCCVILKHVSNSVNCRQWLLSSLWLPPWPL